MMMTLLMRTTTMVTMMVLRSTIEEGDLPVVGGCGRLPRVTRTRHTQQFEDTYFW